MAFYTNVLTAAQILNHYNVGTNNISAPAAPPSFVNEPATPNQIYSGVPITLTALVSGSAPLSYQWFSNNVAVPGQTNNAFTFTPVYPGNNGASYYVAVTNLIGSTNSTTNVLTVLTNLNISAPPFSITRNVGSDAAFRVAVTASATPIGYQWSVSPDGVAFTPLPGETNSTLWQSNLVLSMSGAQYAVVVTNPFVSYSNSASLTVQARTENVPLTGYAAIIAADNPVAYYRLNEPTNSTTAVDAVGSFDGTYNNSLGPIDWGIPTVIPGDTNLGVELQDTNTASGFGGVVDIPYALELNPYGTWSFEGWFQPILQDGLYRTVCSSMYNSNYSSAVFGWLIYQTPGSAFALVTFNGTGGPATFGVDTNNAPLKLKTWYHLAIVDNGATIQLYINGAPSANAQGPAAQFIPDGVNGDPGVGAAQSVLGQRSDLAFNGFNGGVSEVAFYNYPLTQSQITAHVTGKTGTTLTLSQAGGITTLTWPTGNLLGSTNITGPFQAVVGATSPYTVQFTNNSQFFYVVGVPK